MDDHVQRIAKEYDELDNKIHKVSSILSCVYLIYQQYFLQHKKSAKGEAKAAEYVKQQEQKLVEWNKIAVEYLEKHQKVDEFRWDSLKSTIHKFESIQQTHSERIIEVNIHLFLILYAFLFKYIL
jgi:DNA-directed RNA polymerase subunit F